MSPRHSRLYPVHVFHPTVIRRSHLNRLDLSVDHFPYQLQPISNPLPRLHSCRKNCPPPRSILFMLRVLEISSSNQPSILSSRALLSAFGAAVHSVSTIRVASITPNFRGGQSMAYQRAISSTLVASTLTPAASDLARAGYISNFLGSVLSSRHSALDSLLTGSFRARASRRAVAENDCLLKLGELSGYDATIQTLVVLPDWIVIGRVSLVRKRAVRCP